MVNGILQVDDKLFGMTFEELREYLAVEIADPIPWEWSSVPMDYNGILYSDDNSYVVFFENNRLVGVRTESEIPENAIPSELLDKATAAHGNYVNYWYYQDTKQVFEYDWNQVVNGRVGEYAIFLNPYDNINHICQQITSADFSGGSIQQH